MSEQNETGREVAVVETLPPTPRNPGKIVAGAEPRALIPQDFEGAWRIATAVVAANMAPAGLNTAQQATVAILHGLEIGLTPMAALQSIAIINGRPSIWGDAALALVRASGQLIDFEETMTGEGDQRTARCMVHRKGDKRPIIGEFSIEDAKAAELWSPEAMVTRYNKAGQPYQKKNDSPWHRYWKRMLKMRARAFALRDAFPDVLRGLHIREEQEDVVRAAGDEPEQVAALPAPRQVPPPPPEEVVVVDQPADNVSKPAEVAGDADDDADQNTDDRPADDQPQQPADSGGDLPLHLDRRLSGEERDWLESIDNAFSGCEDMMSLSGENDRLLIGERDKMSKHAQERARAILDRHIERIGKDDE